MTQTGRQNERKWPARPGAWLALGLVAAWIGSFTTNTARADWTTYRGSAQRTGCTDDQPGPRTPGLKWAHKAQEDYVAAPVPEGSAVYFPALGPFNTGQFHCLTAPDDLPRILWSKSAPLLKRPTVCSPVIADGLLIFGDGMHQTDDAILYCLTAGNGRPVWQYPVPGKLVHLEASPTVDQGRVYIAGGAAGVLCLELKRVILDGKEMDLTASQAIVEQRWKELTAPRTDAKNLTYAEPPNEDALPKPAPKLVWQSGKTTWHVDAPLTVAGNSVLVASTFLDEEKTGKRALLCLRATDGGTAWETPLTLNPWAGATVAGNMAIVGCSSIRFDVDMIPKATGEVVAVEIATGRIAWRKPVPGAVLSSIAVKDGLAIFTATDGKVRAWRTDTGTEQWQYDAKRPFFAGPAVAAGTVYAADLAGVLHAITLSNGQKEWAFDVPNAPGAQLPGMVYGSPVVSRGRIYLTTCNVQGDHVGQPSMVVCITDKQATTGGDSLTVDTQQRTISIPCHIAPRKLPTLADTYPLEVIACFPAPLGQKAHEAVVTTEVKPSDLHAALVGLGLQPGSPVRGDTTATPTGPELRILLELPGFSGKPRVVPIEDALIDTRTGRGMLPLKWYFTGSAQREPQSAAPAERTYAANLGGTLVTLFPVTDETVIQSSLSMRPRAVLRLDTNKELLPPEGTKARMIIAVGGTLPPTGLAELLNRRATFAAPPLRFKQPRPQNITVLTPVPLHWTLPGITLRARPREPACTMAAIRQATLPESSMTIQTSATRWPTTPVLLTGTLAREAAADSETPPGLPPIGRVDPERYTRAAGHGADLLRPYTLAKPVALRQTPTPFTRRPIPEPSTAPDAIRLETPIQDNDAPLRSAPPPNKIDLPVRK